MPLTVALAGLYIVALLFALLAIAQGRAARLRWRTRHRIAATHRTLWSIVFLLLALLGALVATALLGYRRLASEALVAEVATRALGNGDWAVTLALPDGNLRTLQLAGDDWQLDARVIKWRSTAVVLGAPPLYRLERIGGRWRDIDAERSRPRSVESLADLPLPDLWMLKRRFPGWLPWVDADYGSAAWLPFVEDGRFTVSLAAAGGLVARPADEATARRVAESGW